MPARIKTSFAEYLKSKFIVPSGGASEQGLKILTLSASSTIRDSIIDAFISLPFTSLDLRVLESRPLFEGASMASSILSDFQTRCSSSPNKTLNLTLYTDASAVLASSWVDLVLLGADAISSDGHVINKIGSLPAVLGVKYHCFWAKVLVLSELEKVEEPAAEGHFEPEQNDPAEVIGCWLDAGIKGATALEEGVKSTQRETTNCNVRVMNVYFERVPADLIDGYICEEGFLDVRRIQDKSAQVEQKRDRYFGYYEC